MVDGGGNLIYGRPDQNPSAAEVNRVVCWLARQPHVEVLRTRNPFARFDHRKLVVVDDRVAWTGGRNFSQQSFFSQHDLSFTLTGPLVGELATCFERFWQEQGGKIEDRGSRIEDRLAVNYPSSILDPRSSMNALARLVGTDPRCTVLAETVYQAVDRAQHHVYVENPYCSDNRLIYKLAQARRRGADVRVVLTLNNDSPVIDHANRVTANRFLRAGVRVYLHPNRIHVKAATVDGCWAYLGTGNFDPLSLRHNRELGVAVSAGPVIAELEEQLFLADFRPEWELREALPVSAYDYASARLASLVL
jgi:cardiolipin synthase